LLAPSHVLMSTFSSLEMSSASSAVFWCGSRTLLWGTDISSVSFTRRAANALVLGLGTTEIRFIRHNRPAGRGNGLLAGKSCAEDNRVVGEVPDLSLACANVDRNQNL